jgi:hypothetical protein
MPSGHVVRGVGGERHLEPRHALVGSCDLELAILDDDVAFVGFHQVRGKFLGLDLDLVERLDHRRHADRTGARAVGAHAHLHLVGVAMDDGDRVDADAKTLGNQLCEGGFMALAVAVRPGQNLDRAHRIDPHFRRFPKPHAGAERSHRG